MIERAADLAQRKTDFVILVIAADVACHAADDHKAQADHTAGDDATKEELADGDAGDAGKDNHGHAGRNDDAERAGGGHQRGGEFAIIAAPLHRGNHDRAERSRVSRCGSRNAAHQDAGENADIAQPSAQPTDEGIGKVDKLLSDAAAFHDGTDEHEKRNTHQSDAVDTVKDALGGDHQGNFTLQNQLSHRGQAQSDGNGRAKEDRQSQKQDDH